MESRAIVSLILVAAACLTFIAQGEPQVIVFIDVGEGGNATVRLVYRDAASGRVSMYLPRFERWDYTVAGGTILDTRVNATNAYFYNNVTFVYAVISPGEFTLNISYRFPFAALYAQDRGWFMSPLFGVSPPSSVYIIVTIADLGGIKAVTLNGAPVTYTREGKTLRVSVPRSSAGSVRITVDFSPERLIEETVFTKSIDGIRVSLQAAPFYQGLSDRIAEVVKGAASRLRYIFGYDPQNLDFRLFLPTMMDLSALGYVMGEDINAGGEGPVHLNLALIRFKEGYMETTIVHELVHKALGALGVPASRELRWFHEGVAQYASLKICEELGVDVSDALSNLEEAVKLFREGVVKPGFVSYWNPAGDEGRYYAASYYIVSALAERRGGLVFIKRVAEEIRKEGGVRSNEELVEVLSSAAGEDLTPLFKSWGFPIEGAAISIVKRISHSYQWILVISLVVIAAAVAFSLAVILARRRGARCPYCYAEVPKDALYCPYCGYPLKQQDQQTL